MADIMKAMGKSGGLGRGNMDAGSTEGNSKLRTPSGTSDFRDPVDTNAPIHVHRLTPPAKPGRGMHDHGKMGG